MEVFKVKGCIEIIGVNPYLPLPDHILEGILAQAGKTRGAIPVCGVLEGRKYTQTLVRFRGQWRFYINTAMLKKSPQRVGEEIMLTIQYDPEERTIAMHPRLEQALGEHPAARQVFEGLSASRKKEIVRYISNLKSELSVEKNVTRAINFLCGESRFVGRDKP